MDGAGTVATTSPLPGAPPDHPHQKQHRILGHHHHLPTPTSQQVGARRLRTKNRLLLMLNENGEVIEGKDNHSSSSSSTPLDEAVAEQLDLFPASSLAPIKSSFYIFFAFILFAISYIFNPPEIHEFIVANLDLVSVTET